MINKRLLCLALFILSVMAFTACRKHRSKPVDNIGLPPTTQTGAQTLGFLLNGEPWIPAGNNGTPRLTGNYDPYYHNGVISVSAYRILSDSDDDSFGFGITDSMNFTTTPATFNLSNTSLLRVTYSSLTKNVDLHSIDDTTYCAGTLTLTKFDKTNFIMSGTFNIVLASLHTDTLKITNGRFDVKF